MDSILGAAWNAIFRSSNLIPIPIYHLSTRSSESPLISNNIHNIHPDNLEHQLKALKKKYTILLLDELVALFLSKKKTEKTTSITFDDGYLSVIREAAPIFESLDIPFTFFINGKLLDEKVFWRDKVRALIELDEVDGFLSDIQKDWNLRMADFYKDSKNPAINSRTMEGHIDQYLIRRKISISGATLYCDWSDVTSTKAFIQCGNHSYSHYVLSSLSDEEQYKEIAVNQQLIKSRTNNESTIFSIPFGNPGTYNDQTLMIIKDLGYKGYVLSGQLQHCRKLEIDKFGLVRINRFMPLDEPVIKGI